MSYARCFYFIYEQALQLLWAVLYKEDSSFKAFVNAKHRRRHRDVRDEQRTGCAGREEICEGERIDDRVLSRC